jgi:hypothetical protein
MLSLSLMTGAMLLLIRLNRRGCGERHRALKHQGNHNDDVEQMALHGRSVNGQLRMGQSVCMSQCPGR